MEMSITSNTTSTVEPGIFQQNSFQSQDLIAPLLKGLSHAQLQLMELSQFDLDWVDSKLETNCRYLSRNITEHLSVLRTVETVRLFFGQLSQKEQLNYEAREQLNRLCVPVLKYALLSPEFLTNEEQVTRKHFDMLLAAVQTLSIDNCHATQLFNDQLIELNNSILLDFSEDSSVFENYLSQFIKVLKQQQQRSSLVIQRLTQAFRGQSIHQTISRNTFERLQKLKDSYPIDDSLFSLLKDGISPALNLYGLNQGCDSQQYLYGLKLVHQLLRSVQPHKDLQSKSQWSGEFGIIQQSIRSLLQGAHHETAVIDNFIKVVKQAQLKALQGSVIEETEERFIANDSLDSGYRQRLMDKLATIKPGQWFDYLVSENGQERWIRCQVVVNEQKSKALMLSNRLGIKVDLLDYRNFIDGLSTKEIKPVKRVRLFQEILQSINDQYH